MKMQWKCLTVLIPMLTGCMGREAGESPSRRSSERPAEQTSSVSTVVDGITGRSAVRHGKQAMEKVRQISEKRDRELGEVLNE